MRQSEKQSHSPKSPYFCVVWYKLNSSRLNNSNVFAAKSVQVPIRKLNINLYNSNVLPNKGLGSIQHQCIIWLVFVVTVKTSDARELHDYFIYTADFVLNLRKYALIQILKQHNLQNRKICSSKYRYNSSDFYCYLLIIIKYVTSYLWNVRKSLQFRWP